MDKNILSDLSLTGCNIKQNEPLSKHTTLGIGGNADYFVEIFNEQQLIQVLKFIYSNKIKFYIIGGGSNILFSDEGFRGIIIKLCGDFCKYEIQENQIICGSAVNLSFLSKTTADRELSGLEYFVGIPGTVGGAIYGNAGIKNLSVSSVLDKIEVVNFTGRKEILTKKDLKFEYRKSNLQRCIIIRAFFILKKTNKNDILKVILQEINKRKISQPIGTKNAGCVFKNPKDDSAGRLIDSLNLKNYSIGDIKVSNIHANFIINESNGSAKDMLNLIEFIRNEVKKKYDINLETEIKIIK
jgi:UDP-N-acetylmuramate dehydrogenase